MAAQYSGFGASADIRYSGAHAGPAPSEARLSLRRTTGLVRLEDDSVMRWPCSRRPSWEELRQCPGCGASWVAVWPEEIEAPPILCRPHPADVRRLKDLDRASTMRAYCLARLAEHLGEPRKAAAVPQGSLRAAPLHGRTTAWSTSSPSTLAANCSAGQRGQQAGIARTKKRQEGDAFLP